MSIEAMKQMIELYDKHCHNNDYGGIEFNKKHGYKFNEAIEALRTALSQQPATGEPVAQWQKRHPVRTGGRWISTDEHDAKWWSERATGWEARALYTRPAPSGLGDSKRLDYLQDRGATIELIAGVAAFYPMRFRVGGLHSSANIDVRAAIDAAMLTAK